MKKRAALDLTQGPVFRKILLFAIPMMLNSLLHNLYTTADTVMVGKFVGSHAMAAVGASTQPLTLLMSFSAGLSLGVTVVCGNLKGAGKQRELEDCIHTSVVAGALCGLVIAVIGVPVTRPLLEVMGTPAEILKHATLYMTIRLSAGVPWFMSLFMTNIFYAYGASRVPMLVNIASGLVNVGLNALLLMVFDMGVEGVAIATVASQSINVVAYFVILYAPWGEYKLRLRDIKLHMQYVRSILRLGIPTGINNIVFALSNSLLQSAVNSFGTEVVAGNTVADNIVGYVSLIVNNFASAAVAATSQCFGAKKYRRIDQVALRACLGCVGLVAALAFMITLFSRPIMELFVNKAEPGWENVIQKGFPKLMICAWGYIIYGLSLVFGGVLRGMRKATLSMVGNMGGVIVPRLLWIWLVIPKMNTPTTLYLIYPISWIISFLLLLLMMLHCRKKLLLPA